MCIFQVIIIFILCMWWDLRSLTFPFFFSRKTISFSKCKRFFTKWHSVYSLGGSDSLRDTICEFLNKLLYWYFPFSFPFLRPYPFLKSGVTTRLCRSFSSFSFFLIQSSQSVTTFFQYRPCYPSGTRFRRVYSEWMVPISSQKRILIGPFSYRNYISVTTRLSQL